MISFPNCKINIGLNVIEKRADGYHNIESVFYPVPLYDCLEILPAKKYSIKTYGLPVETNPKENLITKAFHSIQDKFKIPDIEVHLIKNIPTGSGLGGGSSNAAFTIKILNSMFDLGLNKSEMANIASEIGSDCPFFIYNSPSFVSGKGEIIEEIDLNISGKWLLLVHSNSKSSTVKAFQNVQTFKSNIDLKKVIQENIGHWQQSGIHNQFQESIFNSFPEIENSFHQIKEKALYASLTGSGSSIYGIFDEKMDIEIASEYNWVQLK